MRKVLAALLPFVAVLVFAATSQAYLHLDNAKLVFAYEGNNLAQLYYGTTGTFEPTPYSCQDLGYQYTSGTTCYTRVDDGTINLLQSRNVNGNHRYFGGYERGADECMLTGIDILTWTFAVLHDHTPFRWTPNGCFG